MQLFAAGHETELTPLPALLLSAAKPGTSVASPQMPLVSLTTKACSPESS